MWMNVLLSVGAILQAMIIFIWLWQQVEMNRIEREGLRIANRPVRGPLPDLTIIIPARNEAHRIFDCVASIISQDYPNLRLLVVDDRSDDGTAACVERARAGDERVTVRRIDQLPEGWNGKSHAAWRGAKLADTEWILFLDADCRLESGGLASAVNFALEAKADLLSLWPRDGSEGFWERLLVPLCGAMIVIWYGRANSKEKRTKRAFANGQFLLIRRAAYTLIGGHEAVKEALVEDIPLARIARDHGLSVHSAIGTDICCVRMYNGLHEVISGWQRIYLGVLTPMQIFLCAVSILVGSLPPYVVLPILLLRMPIHDDPWALRFILLGAMHLIALMATSIRFFSIAGCRLRYLLLYPFSCIGVVLILGAAFVHSLGRSKVIWRGTTYCVRGSTLHHER